MSKCVRDGGICGIGGFCNECPRTEEKEESKLIDAALDAALKKSTKLIQRFPRWISVEDRLPEIEEEVLVCHHSLHDDSYIDIGWLEVSRSGENRWYTHEEEMGGTTHWMPLPSPPETIKDKA